MLGLTKNVAEPSLVFKQNYDPYAVNSEILDITSIGLTNSDDLRIKNWRENLNDTSLTRMIVYDKVLAIEGNNYLGTTFFYKGVDTTASLNAKLVDVFYGSAPNEIFMLSYYDSFGYSSFTLIKYVDNNQVGSMIVSGSNTLIFDKSIYTSTSIYLLFNEKMVIMDSTSLSIQFNYDIPNTDVNKLDMDLNSTILILTIVTQCNFYYITQLTPTSTLPTPFKILYLSVSDAITGIKMFQETLLVSSNYGFHQFLMSNGNRLERISYSTGEYHMFSVNIVGNMTAVAFTENTLSKYYYMIKFNSSYVCNGSCSGGCQFGWIRDGNLCHYKNEFTPEPELEPEPESESEPEIEEESPYLEFIDKEAVTQASTTFANVATVFTLNITPKILISFVAFIEDLWLYQYHRKDVRYPSTVWFFLKEVSLMGEMKMSPDFIKFVNFLEEPRVAIPQNEFMLNYLDLSEPNDVTEVYFLNAAEDVYKTNLVMNLLFFGGVKLLHLISYFLKNKFSDVKRLRSIYLFFKWNTCWWTLLISCLQANMMILGFETCLQILQPSFFAFIDKINLLCTRLVLFAIIIYAICFFWLIYAWKPRNVSAGLLGRCKHRESSFFFESMMMVLRQLSRSMVHALLIFNYGSQIIVLVLIDIFYIGAILKMRKNFVSSLVFIFVVAYNIIFLTFDFYFLIEFHFPQLVTSFNRELFGFVTLSSMVGFALLETFYSILEPIIATIRKRCCKEQKIRDVNKKNVIEFLQKMKPGASKQKKRISFNSLGLCQEITSNFNLINKQEGKENKKEMGTEEKYIMKMKTNTKGKRKERLSNLLQITIDTKNNESYLFD